MITDSWVTPYHLLRLGPWTRLRQRYHPSLSSARVRSWTWQSALLRALRWQKLRGWKRLIAQNRWFANKVAEHLKTWRPPDSVEPVVFSYSYTAGPAFRVARSRGWKTVLGQIDGGLAEAQIVRHLHELRPESGSNWTLAPSAYWEAWQEELQLADRVVVNSEWSKRCLMHTGFVEERRISVVPLAFCGPPEATTFERHYPQEFVPLRPLRVLFLGQICVRKGALEVFDAIRGLGDVPVQFMFVGHVMVKVPEELHGNPRVHFAGAIPRSEVAHYYKEADVFLFPTHSDGFGLTQLEAQAWKLPIIASRFCGEVVRDELNGIVLPELNADQICAALKICLRNPDLLVGFSRNSLPIKTYALSELAGNLICLGRDVEN